jgi:hypothetical protein
LSMDTMMRFLGLAALIALAVAPGASGQTEEEGDAAAAGLRVTEYGVGTGVKARDLVGKAESFPAGSRVWFWTRIGGGAEGDRVRHVWLYEGKEVFSIGLSIGGDHWRTYSNKTLPLAGTGAWSVEVRGSDDRVLARQEFRCEPSE